jgi:hypothetical protein
MKPAAPTPGWGSHALRVSLCFTLIFLLLTWLDHETTKVGLKLGYPELNPYMDFSSTWTLWRPALIVLAIGRAIVVVNNLGVIAFGWGIMELPERALNAVTGLPRFWVGSAVNAIFLSMLFKPMTRLVWRLTAGWGRRKGGGV